MSTSHSPYIMPDGGKLRRAELSSKKSSKMGGGSSTGKQSQADLVSSLAARARAHADGSHATAELAELRALESVGVRRRRRWLNEKQLRDAAGPLSAADMAGLFDPVPFGSMRESPLSQIRDDPASAAVWESFRSIDPDKEGRVLQKWQEYNRSLRHPPSSSRPGAISSPAGLALHRWSSVSKASRAALKKAKIASVLALEALVLDLVEQGDLLDQVDIEPNDAFGRILVHGLAQFHHLASTSSGSLGCVTLSLRPTAESPAHEPVAGHPAHLVTCVDVLLAMAEIGTSGLTHEGLELYLAKAGLVVPQLADC